MFTSPFTRDKVPFTVTAPFSVNPPLLMVKLFSPPDTAGKRVAGAPDPPEKEMLEDVPPVAVPLTIPIVPLTVSVWAPILRFPLEKFNPVV